MNLQIKPAKHSGFTLVEILAVVVILAILAVLLFPSIKSLRERMLTIKCASNIRTYGLAVLSMAGDQGGLPYWDGKGTASTETGQPGYNKKLTGGGYLQTTPPIRCPLADSSRYHKINGRYRFPYAGNMALNEYFPKLNVPAPLHRVVLAAETNDWDGFENQKSLNSVMWRGGEPGEEGAIRDDRMPIARYHGSPEKRGLHFFLLDGSVQLVFPVDNDWTKEPVRAPITGVASTGYFYHTTQFANLKNGKLIAQ